MADYFVDEVNGHNPNGYPTWVASTAYVLGDFVCPSVLNDCVYECTIAGTSDATEPIWPTTDGGTVADGGVTWTCRVADGTTMDYALKTWAYGFNDTTTPATADGDRVWFRRNTGAVQTADNIAGGGYAIENWFIGCPRASHSVISSDWTLSSTGVTIDDADMVRLRHQGRYITAPDGRDYLITRVISSTSIVIDRPYLGATVIDQAATILADEDYAGAWAAIDDSTWTIKKANWEADPDDLISISYGAASYNLVLDYRTGHIRIRNFEFTNSIDSYGIVNSSSVRSYTEFLGCLFQNSNNTRILSLKGNVHLGRFIVEGNGAGTAQDGLCGRQYGSAGGYAKNGAIYNCGGDGILLPDGIMYLENVNVGIEIANGGYDIRTQAEFFIKAKDLWLGGTNGYYLEYNSYWGGENSRLEIENYQKILNNHRTLYGQGYFERVAVSDETPNKKLSDYPIKVTPNVSGHDITSFLDDKKKILKEYIIDADTTSKIYTVYIYNDSGATLNPINATEDIFIEAEYVSDYVSDSQYMYSKVFSAQLNIAPAADADDWDTLTVTIQPAVASQVRLSVRSDKYLAATNIFIEKDIDVT